MKITKKQLLLAGLLFAFCRVLQAQAPIQFVPGDVPVLMTVNLGHLNKKVNLAQLRQYDFYQGMIKELEKSAHSEREIKYLQKFFSAPEELGFDMLRPFHFFMKKEGDITYYTIVMKMGDTAKYEDGLRQYKEAAYESNLTQNGKYKLWSGEDETYAWNEHVIFNVWAEKAYSFDDWGSLEDDYKLEKEGEIVYGDEPVEEKEGEVFEEIEETPPPPVDPPNEEILKEETPADEEIYDPNIEGETDYGFGGNWEDGEKKEVLGKWVEKLMQPELDNSINLNKKYNAASANTSDVHVWVDYSYFMETMKNSSGGAYGMMGSEAAMAMDAMQGFMGVFYSDTYMSLGMNFQDGKLAISSEMFVNGDMQRFYNSAFDAKFNKKMLRYIQGGKDMFGYFYMNYNIKNSIDEGKALMHKVLKSTPQYGAMADDAMNILGIFIDEEAIGNLLKGDMLFAVSGMKMMEVTKHTFDMDEDFNLIAKDTVVVKKMPVFTALASYGNKKDIMKFVDLGIHSGVITKEGAYYKMTVPELNINLFMALQKGIMVFTNDQDLIANKLEKGFARKKRLGKKHRKMLCENASAFYWDVPNTLYAFSGDSPTSGDPMVGYLDMLAKQFDSLEMTSSKKVENSVKGNIDFNFTNKGTNSLEQFFNFVNDLYIEFIGGARI